MAACSSARRCRSRLCSHCGPIRAGDEYRKFHDNIAAYGGRVILVAVTGPGDDVLPREEGRVGVAYAYGWNRTASRRYARLWKAATASADRVVRRCGWRGELPVRVANVWALQRRGIWHVHEALPAATPVELMWSRQVVRFIDAARRREFSMSGEERWALLEMEAQLGVTIRGFYGFGFVDRNPLRGRVDAHEGVVAAAYLARNVATYLGENLAAAETAVGRELRAYVSRRLTAVTGCTMRNLRRARYLFVVVRDSLPLPDTWTNDELERVWRLLVGVEVAARAP